MSQRLVVAFCGDPRQTLPVITKASRSVMINASMIKCPQITKLILTKLNLTEDDWIISCDAILLLKDELCWQKLIWLPRKPKSKDSCISQWV